MGFIVRSMIPRQRAGRRNNMKTDRKNAFIRLLAYIWKHFKGKLLLVGGCIVVSSL